MDDQSVEMRPTELLENRPPAWRTTLSGMQDLGFPDFVPARPGHSQPEDKVTEQNVKLGFQGTNTVSLTTEGFSVHGPIGQKLKLPNAMDSLSNLADEILAVRAQSAPAIPSWSFKLPNRVVYNENMRQAFIADLANPDFPLHRLAKSIPHGYKGQDLLEMLYTKEIPVDRAAWLIQALGAHEVHTIRNRTGSNHTSSISPTDQYSIEFTAVCCAFLRKQLAEIALPPQRHTTLVPSKPAAAVAGPRQGAGGGNGTRPLPNFKSVLADENSRARWLTKWEYSLTLIKWLMSRNLLDERTFASWIADQVGASNLAQLGFAASLMDQFLHLLWKSIMVARPAIRACVDQLAQIRAHKLRHTLSGVEGMLTKIVQLSYDWRPEVLVCPASWLWHEDLLKEIVLGQSEDTPCVNDARFRSIKQRNDSMLLRDSQVVSTGWSANRQSMATIQILDSVNATSKVHDVYLAFFGNSTESTWSLKDASIKIHMLLSWSVGFGHLGNHRPYLCSSLLQLFKEDKVVTGTKGIDCGLWLEDVIFEWLDRAASERNEHKYIAIGTTIGELTRLGLFSLGHYLRRQIARGINDRSAQERIDAQQLRRLLQHLPIFASSPALVSQRKVVLFGDMNAPDEQEDEIEQVRREIGEYLADLGTGYAPSHKASRGLEVHELPLARAASRYVQVQMRMWLLPVLLKTVPRLPNMGLQGNRLFARIIHVLEDTRGMATIHQVLLRAIPSASLNLLDDIIYVTMRHLDVWAAMDTLDSLAGTIFERFNSFEKNDNRPRHESPMAWELARKANLCDKHAEKLRKWLTMSQALPTGQTLSSETVPSTLHTVQQIHRERELSKVQKVGRDLWQRFDHDPDFPAVVWRNALDSVQAVREAEGTESQRRQAVASIATLLSTVGDLHANLNGWRSSIYAWCAEQAKGGFLDLSAKSDDVLMDLFLALVEHRSLSTKSVLHYLIQPIWRHLSQSRAMLNGSPTQRDINVLLCSVRFSRYAFSLKVDDQDGGDPDDCLRTSQCFRANAAAVFEDNSAMQDLIQHLALLPVFEVALQLTPTVGAEVSALREGISNLATFKKGAFRHLDLLKDAFLTRQVRLSTNETQLDTALVEGLLLIMTESDDVDSPGGTASYDWTDERAELSPWQWKRAVLELRLSFKRLSMRLRLGEAVESGDTSVEDFAASLLDRHLTPDQMALVDEAMKGIDTVAVNSLLKAGVRRLAAQLLSIIHADDSKRQQVVAQIRTVSTILALALNHSRRAGYHLRASSGGIADPATYITSLRSLVDHLNNSEGRSQKSDDILETSFLTLRLYLGMVGGSPEMASLPPAVIGSILEATNDLIKIAQSRRKYSRQTCIDIFSYVMDELPKERRIAVYDKLVGLAKQVVAAPTRQDAWVPIEIKELASTNTACMDATIGDVFNRQRSPWDLLPAYEPQNGPMTHANSWSSHSTARNGGSLDLASFGAQLTGDRLASAEMDQEDRLTDDAVEFSRRPWEMWVSERDLGAGRTGESIFSRDWAVGVVGGPPKDFRVASNSATTTDALPSTPALPLETPTTQNGTPIKGTSLADAIEIDDDDEGTSTAATLAQKRKRTSSPTETSSKSVSTGGIQRRGSQSDRTKRPRVGSKSVAKKAPAKVAPNGRKASVSAGKNGRRKSSGAA